MRDNMKLKKDTPIAILGHSMGGAVAAYLALRLIEEGHKGGTVGFICSPIGGTYAVSNLMRIQNILEAIEKEEYMSEIPFSVTGMTSERLKKEIEKHIENMKEIVGEEQVGTRSLDPNGEGIKAFPGIIKKIKEQ